MLRTRWVQTAEATGMQQELRGDALATEDLPPNTHSDYGPA